MDLDATTMFKLPLVKENLFNTQSPVYLEPCFGLLPTVSTVKMTTSYGTTTCRDKEGSAQTNGFKLRSEEGGVGAKKCQSWGRRWFRFRLVWRLSHASVTATVQRPTRGGLNRAAVCWSTGLAIQLDRLFSGGV